MPGHSERKGEYGARGRSDRFGIWPSNFEDTLRSKNRQGGNTFLKKSPPLRFECVILRASKEETSMDIFQRKAVPERPERKEGRNGIPIGVSRFGPGFYGSADGKPP